MKITKKQAIGENLLYMMVWLAIILVPVLNSKMMSELHVSLENVLTTWRKIAPYLTIFLVHNTVIARRYLLRHKYWRYLFCDLALIISVFWLVDLYEQHYVVETDVLYGSNDDVIRHKASFTDLEMYWNIILGLFMTGANSGIKLMYQSIRDEQKMEELKQQNMQAQMDYLKYQINPHFFMNTLNNIHAMIDFDSQTAKRCVIELSKMMRYVLYDTDSDRTTLDKEIQFVGNYIELMRIRYVDDVDIRFEHPSATVARGVVVPPLLLIVFVENAFKHGVSYDAPSFIHIDISLAGGELRYRVVNSRHKRQEKRGGVGLENVRKRLSLLFGKRHTLADRKSVV